MSSADHQGDLGEVVVMPVVWLVLGFVIVVAAVRAQKSESALRVGRLAVATLYVGAGAMANAVYLIGGEDYADFAEGSYIPFVRDTWSSLVVPNHHVFIWVLVAFEAAVGILVAMRGRPAVAGLVGAIGFHVALLSFGWGFYLWAVPMLAALAALLRVQLRTNSARPAEPVSAPTPHGQLVGTDRRS